jgi:hypothetical protein
LEAALLARTGVLVCLAKGDEGCVVADDLTRETALCRHGDGSLVCAGSLGRGGQLIKLREYKDAGVLTVGLLRLRRRRRLLLLRRGLGDGIRRVFAFVVADEEGAELFEAGKAGGSPGVGISEVMRREVVALRYIGKLTSPLHKSGGGRVEGGDPGKRVRCDAEAPLVMGFV